MGLALANHADALARLLEAQFQKSWDAWKAWAKMEEVEPPRTARCRRLRRRDLHRAGDRGNGAGSSEPRGCACPVARLAQAVAPSGAPHPRPYTGSSLFARTCPRNRGIA